VKVRDSCILTNRMRAQKSPARGGFWENPTEDQQLTQPKTTQNKRFCGSVMSKKKKEARTVFEARTSARRGRRQKGKEMKEAQR